jgi:hypothetical protein
VGGTDHRARNVISANASPGGVADGVHISGAGATGTPTHDIAIQGNFIGTDIDGSLPLGDGDDGVAIDSGAFGNTIGGTESGAGNLIAFNAGNGVTVGNGATDDAAGNAILGNSIHGNGGIGIDLGNDGPTANTPGGPHDGPNELQNTPVLGTVLSDSTSTVIRGSINSAPDTTYRVEFFGNSAGSQGQTFLGFLNVTTDDRGHAQFTFDATTRVTPGSVVTATATDPAGNTSEFSDAAPSVRVPDDVSARVTVTRSGFVFNRRTGYFVQTVTLTNISAHALAGPIALVLDGLTPGVTLSNAAGATKSGSPTIDVAPNGGILAAGGVVTITLQFVDPGLKPINYATRILAGVGQD